MSPQAILGAVVGALVGAGIWAAIVLLTGYEVGYVAWGVGILVGLGARLFDGEGNSMGITCAVLALLAIFAGKAIAVSKVLHDGIGEVVAENVSQANYGELITDAEIFASLESEEHYPQFMVTREYTEASRPERVTAEELADFKQYSAPYLREIQANPPSFEQWQEEQSERIAAVVGSSIDFGDALTSTLGPLDLVFGVLGLITAHRVGSGSARET